MDTEKVNKSAVRHAMREQSFEKQSSFDLCGVDQTSITHVQ